jgi:hypothetical protein
MSPARTPRVPRVPRDRPQPSGVTVSHSPVTSSPPRGKDVTPAAGKKTRVTLDLDPDRYAALRKWLAAADAEMSPVSPRVSLAAALRAMIDATTMDKSIGLVVVDLLRRNQP